MEDFQEAVNEVFLLLELLVCLRLADQPVDEEVPGRRHALGVESDGGPGVVLNIVQEMTSSIEAVGESLSNSMARCAATTSATVIQSTLPRERLRIGRPLR